MGKDDESEETKWKRKVEKQAPAGRSASVPSSGASAVENPRTTIRKGSNKGKNKPKGKTASNGNGEIRIQGHDGKFRDSDSGPNNESKSKDPE